MPQKKEIQIVKMSKDQPDEGLEKPPKETTVPLSVQPRNIRDTAETSTPYSKKKQVSQFLINDQHFTLQNMFDLVSIF